MRQEKYAFGPSHWHRETAIAYYEATQRSLRDSMKTLTELRHCLIGLMDGHDCWCDKYYDPMCGHQKKCESVMSMFLQHGWWPIVK